MAADLDALPPEFARDALGAVGRLRCVDLHNQVQQPPVLTLTVAAPVSAADPSSPGTTGQNSNAALVVEALRAAVRSGCLTDGTIVHTDRGVQHTCTVFRRELERVGAWQSLSRSGSCLDDAPAESFFASLRCEIGQRVWSTRQAAVHARDSWIGVFYNTERLHSTIGYLTPAQVAARWG